MAKADLYRLSNPHRQMGPAKVQFYTAVFETGNRGRQQEFQATSDEQAHRTAETYLRPNEVMIELYRGRDLVWSFDEAAQRALFARGG